ncbi:MAG: methylated-DNA--[protein]-cysteine S-methyltransferase [Solirubrobacteraceae bacterium]
MTTEIEDLLRQGPPGEDPVATARDAAATLAARAEEEGLVDLAYAELDSPLGTLVAAVSPKGLVRLAYEDGRRDAVLEDLAARVSPRVLEAPARLEPLRRELDEYWNGRREHFDVALDLRLTRPGFTRRILTATTQIPFGESSTYLGVAERAGSPRAVRAAGNALGSNPIPIVVPCHRVLRTGGGLGGYTGGLQRKEFLLGLEHTLGS